MPTYEESLTQFKDEAKKLGINIHEDLYHAICDHLGSAMQDRDASLVACSDKKERETIKENFLIGKLKLQDGPHLDNAIEQVCGHMGQSNKHKHRATFYYLLVGLLKKEYVFIKS